MTNWFVILFPQFSESFSFAPYVLNSGLSFWNNLAFAQKRQLSWKKHPQPKLKAFRCRWLSNMPNSVYRKLLNLDLLQDSLSQYLYSKCYKGFEVWKSLERVISKKLFAQTIAKKVNDKK